MEVWREIAGYEGLYEISNLGNVRSLPKYNHPHTHLLTPTRNKRDGRLSVMLCKNPKTRKRVSVHRLVAIAFVENPNPSVFTEINHKDENPSNNEASNLEWCDRWYNTHYNNLHERISRPQRKQILGHKPGGECLVFKSMAEANNNGFCRRVLSDIINGKRGRGNYYKGYFWEVANAN